MKTYPTITRVPTNTAIYAFDKLDGSNIRAEWSRKRGFYKFGSRKRLVDPGDQLLGKSIPLIQDKYSDELSKLFKEQRWQKGMAFFEYHGPNSFAGWHDENDAHTVTLFDVAGDKKGILEPTTYLKIFGHLDIAPLLYTGNANSEFVATVKEGNLDGMTFEGVVCKGKAVSPGLPLMFKVKNQAWIDRLRGRVSNDEEFNRLL